MAQPAHEAPELFDAIADVAGVCPVSEDELHDADAIAERCPPGATPAVVTILSVSASSRRRLDHVAGHIVVVEYEVEAVDVAAIEDVESALAKAEEDTTIVDEALEDAAKAATLEAAQTGGDTSVAQAFAAVTTQQLHSEVVAPSPAPTAVPTLAPTVSPTTVEDYEKQQRKARLRIAALIGIVVAAVVVAGCAAVAIFAFAMGKGPCKKKKKTKMAAEGGPSAPPAPVGAEEAPPLAPITLGGAEVDVSQEEVCSPRRVNLVYAPLATWYNTTEKGAALRATHGPLPANPDAFNKWASMKEVTMAFLDDAGVPPAF